MPILLTDSVETLPGVGAARAKALRKLGIGTAYDLLCWYPRAYEDRSEYSDISRAPEDRAVCVRGTVVEPPRTDRLRKGLEVTKVKVADASSCMTAVFFNQSYVKRSFQSGVEYVFFGRVEGAGMKRAMTNPAFEREGAGRITGRILPVYSLAAGLTNQLLVSLLERVLADCAGQLPEVLPQEVRLEHGLVPAEPALRAVHAPPSWEALAQARRRLIFEELFCLTAGLSMLRGLRDARPGPVISPGGLEAYFAALPFELTTAQRRAIDEAAGDMASGRLMNRLVQGDVGSGKTAVAAACAFLCARSGLQTAMMAPTELLARQHFQTLSKLLAGTDIRIELLTGSLTAAEKRRRQEALAQGEVQVAVGTHALLSQGVSFSRLGLVITDEQHRFGVDQRSALAEKGGGQELPHVLVMSATPIPRTLALMIYGDLDLSVIDELPPGRRPVQTFLIGETKRERMYGFVRRLAGEGRQVYMVCPTVEEGEAGPTLKSVTEYAALLREEIFPDLRVGFVHGRMKAAEKNRAMESFAAGGLDVLVSTTVIEVGVDVPNAALMVVENAERFGLGQLHQLRGRVGRGEHQSFCILVSGARSEETRRRLKVLTETGDGFRIAREDLALRGPGDFFGARQHGLPQLKIADLAGDMGLLTAAQEAARALLAQDGRLEQPEHLALRARVEAMFAQHAGGLN